MSKTIKSENLKEAFHRDDLKSQKTTSAKVRYLDSLGFDRVEITKILYPIRYQHVRNILVTPIKTIK